MTDAEKPPPEAHAGKTNKDAVWQLKFTAETSGGEAESHSRCHPRDLDAGDVG